MGLLRFKGQNCERLDSPEPALHRVCVVYRDCDSVHRKIDSLRRVFIVASAVSDSSGNSQQSRQRERGHNDVD